MTSWVWLLLSLGLLLVLERWLHRHLQGLILLLVRNPDVALLIYSLILFPGVLLHEGSHWLTATFLGVRAGHFSVWPARQPDGTLRLGYVETAKVDFLREAFIGAAPLVLGGVVVSLVGLFRLNLGPVGQALGQGDLVGAIGAARVSLHSPDAWMWIYVVFAVSNSMLPSASDRRAWPLVVLLLAVLGAVLFYAGIGSLVLETLTEPVDQAVRAVAAVFSITIGMDLLVIPAVWLLEVGVVRVTGMKVEY